MNMLPAPLEEAKLNLNGMDDGSDRRINVCICTGERCLFIEWAFQGI